MKEVLKKEVREMIHDNKLVQKIEAMGIHTIEELCQHSRIELSQMGLDLKPNHAKKNHLILE